MTTIGEQREIPVEPGGPPVISKRPISRRELLKGLAVGGASVAVVGTGAAGVPLLVRRAPQLIGSA
jgi:hypothetical protein